MHCAQLYFVQTWHFQSCKIQATYWAKASVQEGRDGDNEIPPIDSAIILDYQGDMMKLNWFAGKKEEKEAWF